MQNITNQDLVITQGEPQVNHKLGILNTGERLSLEEL
jgi:hypothetical protein